jgi:hypothetical protein
MIDEDFVCLFQFVRDVDDELKDDFQALEEENIKMTFLYYNQR